MDLDRCLSSPPIRFHWIGANHSGFGVVTFRALEIADVIPGRTRHDAGKHHAVLTFWTTGALDGNERGLWSHMRLRHVVSPLDQAGALNSQSPVDAESGGDAASMEPLKFPRCSICSFWKS